MTCWFYASVVDWMAAD